MGKRQTVTAGLQPGLARRLDALLAPCADAPLQSPALAELLTHLALWGEETTPQREDVATLSTYHSAKGLEFECVVCMDVHDNAFPPYFARDPEERRESRRDILRLAESGALVLAIPAYSLMEPYETLIRDAQRRQSLASELEQELTQLGRAEAFEAEIEAFEELAALLTRRREQELSRLRLTKKRLLRAGTVLPLSGSVLEESLRMQDGLNLSPQDAGVLASVLQHVRSENTDGSPSETSCFVNRDASDFGDPDIEERLSRYGCQIKYRFDDGLRFIQSHLA